MKQTEIGRDGSDKSSHALPIWMQLLLGGTSTLPAIVITHPLDVIKVRLQLQSNVGASFKYRGTFSGIVAIAREEGVSQLFKGLSPAIVRAYTFSAVRLGSYESFRSLFKKLFSDERDETSFACKLGAGLSSGIAGSLFTFLHDIIAPRNAAPHSCTTKNKAQF